MLESNRIGATLVGLALAFLGAFSVGLWAGEAESRYGDPQQYAYENGYPDAKGDSSVLGVHPVTGPRSYQDICANPQSHDDADLCQQWRAASAGRDTARFAAWQLFLSVIGVGGLGITVYLSNKATNAATEATKAAVRSAEASERMLIDFERPYVAIAVDNAGIEMELNGNATIGSDPFKYTFTNYGRAPAALLAFDWDPAYLPVNSGTPAPKNVGEPKRDIPHGVIVGADKPYPETDNPVAVFDFTRIVADDWWKTERLFWHGWFRYSDIVGSRTFLVGFCFMFDPVGGRFVLTGGKEHNYTRAFFDQSASYPHLAK